MKRNRESISDQPRKQSKLNTVNKELSDDSIYEICEWIPSRVLLGKCLLINKRWHNIIKEHSRITLDVTLAEWKEFGLSERWFAQKVDSLTMRGLFETISIETSVFNRLTNLKTLSLSMVDLGQDLVEHIVSNTAIDNLELVDCDFFWSDLMPLTRQDRPIYLSLGYNSRAFDWRARDDTQYSVSCEDVIPQIKLLRRLTVDPSIGSVLVDNSSNLCQFLKKADHLSQVTLALNQVSEECIPLMKNLTSLSLFTPLRSDKVNNEWPDLSPLNRLKKLKIEYYSPFEDREIGLLEPILHQLQELSIDCRFLFNSREKALVPSLDKLRALKLCDYRAGVFGSFPNNLTRLDLYRCIIDERELGSLRGLIRLIHFRAECVHVNPPATGGEASTSEKHQSCSLKHTTQPQDDAIMIKKHSRPRYPFTFDSLCSGESDSPVCVLENLTYLSIDPPRQESNSLKALSRMRELTHLSIQTTVMADTDERIDFGYIASAASLTRLHVTRVDCITSDDIRLISSMTHLRWLTLSNDYVLGEQLANISSMDKLVTLELHADVNQEGLKHISLMKGLRNLRFEYESTESPCVSILSSMPCLIALDVRCAPSMIRSIREEAESNKNLIDVSIHP